MIPCNILMSLATWPNSELTWAHDPAEVLTRSCSGVIEHCHWKGRCGARLRCAWCLEVQLGEAQAGWQSRAESRPVLASAATSSRTRLLPTELTFLKVTPGTSTQMISEILTTLKEVNMMSILQIREIKGREK